MDNITKQRAKFDELRADLNDCRYRKVYQILKKIPKGKILEIGCCSGEFLELLKKDSWDVEGLEISEKAAKRGLKKGIKIQGYDANKKLPFDDNVFDVVFAGELIEHTFDDIDFLKECKRIIKPNGRIIISTPNLISLKNRILMLFGKDPRFAIADYHYHVYTPHLIKRAFKKAGLSNIRLTGNYVIYTKNREKILGTLFEKIGTYLPSLAEHFIIMARKS